MRSQWRTLAVLCVTMIIVVPPRSVASVSTMRCSVAVVEVRRRFVEDEDARARVERSGEPDPLPLAAGEPYAALADDRLEAVRQGRDDVVEAGEPDRLDDALVVDLVAVPAERDVGAERVVDEVDVLGHVADRALPGLAALRERRPVDGHAAGIRLEQCRG